jgi:hypothetical protein
MEFTLTHPDSGQANILVLFDGVPYEADSNHPWWDEILALTFKDDPRVIDLFSLASVERKRKRSMQDQIEALEEANEFLCDSLREWQERAWLLESAVKTYAGHVWNDIKQKLKEQERHE